jgi:MSHA biogenesis protein MshO
MTMARSTALREKGFTLAESIIVIVIMGILFAAVAVFIQSPVKGFFDTARRAQLVDIADTALQRISRDVRLALPNSVRLASSGGKNYLEFLLTSGGGRYRANAPGSNVLVAGTPTTIFDVFGPMPTLNVGDSIVVFNLFSDPTATSANAYVGDNRTPYSSNTASTITVAKTFPFDSPAHRFQVVQYPVTYACDQAPGGVLRRYWGYAIAASQPTPPVTANQALLASNAKCSFTYAAGASQRNAVLVVSVSLTLGNETVSLFKQVHVNNVP